MKTIILNNKKNISDEKKEPKIREKMQAIDISLNNIIQNNIFNTNNINSNTYQKNLLNKLYLNEDFIEKKLLISELKSKINSYKSQDIKKDFHEFNSLYVSMMYFEIIFSIVNS